MKSKNLTDYSRYDAISATCNSAAKNARMEKLWGIQAKKRRYLKNKPSNIPDEIISSGPASQPKIISYKIQWRKNTKCI